MAQISRIEYYLPETVVTNEDLIRENPNWDIKNISDKVGIKQRHIASEEETSLDLAFNAANKVLQDYDRDSIDYLILCTQSPDYHLPTSACILQDKLSLRVSTGAHDFNLGCSGYVYGLAMAKGLISGKIASNILLITSETYSKFIHPKDKTNRAIFGDAAAATIIESGEREGIYNFQLGSDGAGFDKLIVKNGLMRKRTEQDIIEWSYGTDNITSDNHLYMDGPSIYNFTINTVPKMVLNLLGDHKLTIGDIDYFIFHQANRFMLNYIRKKLGIEKGKFHFDIENTGNTVSSTIPIALKDAISNNNVKKGDRILLAGFGVGLSYGATIIEL